MLKKIYIKLRAKYYNQKRKRVEKKRINYKNRLIKKLRNKNFTLITNNCIGGVIYNKLNLKFLSPTINLDISDEDYVTLVNNFEEFITKGEFIELKEEGKDYPIGLLKSNCGEIVVRFMHYKTYDEAIKKWNERCSRINWNNLYILWETRGKTSDTLIERFLNCKIKNKFAFSLQIKYNHSQYKYIETGIDYFPGQSIQYQSEFSYKLWLDEIDYVKFLNKKQVD